MQKNEMRGDFYAARPDGERILHVEQQQQSLLHLCEVDATEMASSGTPTTLQRTTIHTLLKHRRITRIPMLDHTKLLLLIQAQAQRAGLIPLLLLQQMRSMRLALRLLFYTLH